MAQDHFTPIQLDRLAAAMQRWIASHPEPDTPAFSLGWGNFLSPREISDGVGQAVAARKGAAPGPLAKVGEDMIEIFESCLGSVTAESIIRDFGGRVPERDFA